MIRDVAVSGHVYDAGGLVILSDNDLRVYAPTTASQPHEDGGKIEKWKSTDKSKTWTNTAHMTLGSEYSYNQVKIVFNSQKRKGLFRVF